MYIQFGLCPNHINNHKDHLLFPMFKILCVYLGELEVNVGSECVIISGQGVDLMIIK
jgi:hypothetical protein